MVTCPKCQSTNGIKHGRIHNGKQRYLCKDCGHQFIENSKQKIVSHEKKEAVGNLLLERVSLRGIVRSFKLSRSWLQNHVNTLYGRVERFFKLDDRLIEVFSKSPSGSLTLECDEMWSFVGNKARKFWIWLSCDEMKPLWKNEIALWDASLEIEARRVHGNSWLQYPKFFEKKWIFIPISGIVMKITYPTVSTTRVEKKRVIQTMWKEQMEHFEHDAQDWCEPIMLFLKKKKTISAQFGTSFITIMKT
jgi:transposase-like protein